MLMEEHGSSVKAIGLRGLWTEYEFSTMYVCSKV